MSDKNTNDVRQILMNELGLTRESIRKEVDRIVAGTIASHLRGDAFKQTLDRIVKAELTPS